MGAMDREFLRTALSRATQSRPCAEIAIEVGIRANLLYTFLSRGTLGADKVDALQHWLVNHGYVPEITMTPRQMLAHECELAAAILRSPAHSDRQAADAVARLKQTLNDHP